MTINTNNNNNMMTHDHEAFIHQIRLFSGLTSQELKSIDKGKEVWFEAGDKILAEGEHDAFYVVLDGEVEVILRDGSKEAYFLLIIQEIILESCPLFLDGQTIVVRPMLQRKAIY
jgi:CRP-like cAMP-binding protein